MKTKENHKQIKNKRKMENLKKMRYLLFGVLVLIISCTGNQKRKIAEKEFCNHLTTFANALDNLAVANKGTDVNAFSEAFDKADRAWNRLEGSAENLEEIQMEQSAKAYNKLVDQVNTIAANPDNTDANYQITQQIQSTADELAGIQTVVCD